MAELDAAREVLLRERLYAITPDDTPDRIEVLVRAWLEAGVRLVQLRQKLLPRGELLELARRLQRLVEAAHGLLAVNDHADIALLAGAGAVHVGPDDLSVAAVRRVVGPALVVGASAQTAAEARAAAAAGADYLGSGPAYPTATKTSKKVIGPPGIAAVAAAVEVPVFAIGGVTAELVPELRQAGLQRACAIGALAGDRPGAAAESMLSALA